MKITRENASDKLISLIAENKKMNQLIIAQGSDLSAQCICGIIAKGRKPDTLTVHKLNKYLKDFPEIEIEKVG